MRHSTGWLPTCLRISSYTVTTTQLRYSLHTIRANNHCNQCKLNVFYHRATGTKALVRNMPIQSASYFYTSIACTGAAIGGAPEARAPSPGASKKWGKCTKMLRFSTKNQNIFWGRGTASSPDPSPNGEGDPSPDPSPPYRSRSWLHQW